MKNKLEKLDETITLWKQSTTPMDVYSTGVLNGLLLAKSTITGCEFHPYECKRDENAPNLIDPDAQNYEVRHAYHSRN